LLDKTIKNGYTKFVNVDCLSCVSKQKTNNKENVTMQCKYCGAELKGNWCPKCGKTANAGGLGKSSQPFRPGQAPQKVVPPRATNTTQDKYNSHLSGFGDRAKQELKHQKAVANSGPDWGGQKRLEKRSRRLELLFTGILLLSGLVLFVAFVLPFFATVDTTVLDADGNPMVLPGKGYSGLGSFAVSGGIGIWVLLAFIFTLILIVATVLRFIVVAGKLQSFKFLDTPIGSVIITGAGLAVAIFAFLLYSTVDTLIKQTIELGGANTSLGQGVSGDRGLGLTLLMPMGFVTLAIAIGVIIVRLFTLTNYKKAVKPTAETVMAAKAQGNNFGFGIKQNTFNRQKEEYQPVPVKTMADTVGAPPPKFDEMPPMMDEGQFQVDEFGNPILPTEEDLMAGAEPVEQMAPPPPPPVAPRPAAHTPPPPPPPAAPAAPVADAKLSPAEAARQKLAEAKAKLAAAKKANKTE